MMAHKMDAAHLLLADDSTLTSDELLVKKAIASLAQWATENATALAIGRVYGFEVGVSPRGREAISFAVSNTVDPALCEITHSAVANIGRFEWAAQSPDMGKRLMGMTFPSKTGVPGNYFGRK